MPTRLPTPDSPSHLARLPNSAVVSSTSVPIADRFFCPMIRSPSQCPGTARSAASAGRSAMLIMFRARFLRCPGLRHGFRTARPVLKHLVRSRFRAPRDRT